MGSRPFFNRLIHAIGRRSGESTGSLGGQPVLDQETLGSPGHSSTWQNKTKDLQGSKKQISSKVLRDYLNEILFEVVKSVKEILVEIIKLLPKIIKSALVDPIKTLQILLILFLIIKSRQILNWLDFIFRPIHSLEDRAAGIGHGITHGASLCWSRVREWHLLGSGLINTTITVAPRRTVEEMIWITGLLDKETRKLRFPHCAVGEGEVPQCGHSLTGYPSVAHKGEAPSYLRPPLPCSAVSMASPSCLSSHHLLPTGHQPIRAGKLCLAEMLSSSWCCSMSRLIRTSGISDATASDTSIGPTGQNCPAMAAL